MGGKKINSFCAAGGDTDGQDHLKVFIGVYQDRAYTRD